MKAKYVFLMMVVPIFILVGQSSIEYESETFVEVTTGADICADNIFIDGAFSGDGTQCNGPLPVELISFSATSKNQSIELQWRTATEINNYGFEIERRVVDGLNIKGGVYLEWSNIGFIEGNGTTNAPNDYSFTDKNFSSGKYVYRLKQINRDGSFMYSHEVEIEIINIPVPKVFALQQNYPNPFNPSTTIGFTLQSSDFISLKVYDVIGKEVQTLVNEHREAEVYHQVVFSAANVSSSGIFFAKLISGHETQIIKMILMK